MATENNSAMDMGVQIPLQGSTLNCFGICPEVKEFYGSDGGTV